MLIYATRVDLFEKAIAENVLKTGLRLSTVCILNIKN